MLHAQKQEDNIRDRSEVRRSDLIERGQVEQTELPCPAHELQLSRGMKSFSSPESDKNTAYVEISTIVCTCTDIA